MKIYKASGEFAGVVAPPTKFNEKIVAVKQGNILATAFHPELTTDISLHKYFVKIIQQSLEKNN